MALNKRVRPFFFFSIFSAHEEVGVVMNVVVVGAPAAAAHSNPLFVISI